MSSYTIATLPRMSSTELSEAILATASSNLDAPTPPSRIAVIDVRDDDHIGGHIKHSIHVPSTTLDYRIPELVRKLQGKDTVIFHCALSQQRGPSAALQYIRERDRLLGLSAKVETGKGGIGKVPGKNAEDKKDREEDVKDGEDGGNGETTEQKVYVLEKGFVGWQERYGEDSRLTEGYRKEIWKDGY